MPHRYLLLMFLLVACCPAQAEIFKCVAPNGDLTFSQTPCPDKGSKVTVERTVSTSSDNEADCTFAHRFALATARQMQRGVASSTVFDRYGGLSALSRGSVSLISYVYQYRTNDDVSAERVAALSVAKCKAKSFGDVSCEQLPDAYTNSLGGCEAPEAVTETMAEERSRMEAPPPAGTAYTLRTAPQAQSQLSAEARARQQAQFREAQAREEEQRVSCKQRVRKQLDLIRAELRSGYSASKGIGLRDRRRELEQQLRDC